MLFERAVELPASIETCFAYHERLGALNRLLPPWESVSIERSDNSLEPGSEVLLKARLCGLTFHWLARHEQLDRPKRFVDRQVTGPFAEWRHEHCFESLDKNRTRLVDRIQYQLPFGTLGSRISQSIVERKLSSMFEYRHRITQQDLQFGSLIESATGGMATSKRVAVSGSHGLIGTQVVSLLSVLGHRVIRLERPEARSRLAMTEPVSPHSLVANQPTSTVWDPQSGLATPQDLNGLDAIIHLAGKGIGDGRWTERTKADLTSSRVDATSILVGQLSKLPQPPKAFISASGVGIYGDRGSEELDESQPASNDFLGQLALGWEQASQMLVNCGTRVCVGRLGIVLTPAGGALAKMLPTFRWGLGGRFGSGKQYWSWIGHQDAVSAFVWMALNEKCRGPYNFVSGSATNQEFTNRLATTLSRPAFLPVPAFVLRTAMGGMADSLLLNSTRASGHHLVESGYRMRQTDLSQTFRELLGVHDERDSDKLQG